MSFKPKRAIVWLVSERSLLLLLRTPSTSVDSLSASSSHNARDWISPSSPRRPASMSEHRSASLPLSCPFQKQLCMLPSFSAPWAVLDLGSVTLHCFWVHRCVCVCGIYMHIYLLRLCAYIYFTYLWIYVCVCVWRYISWKRKWQPTPVFLPREFHGQRSLVDYNPWGHKESETTSLLNMDIYRENIIYM